jgi:hypothetical protein
MVLCSTFILGRAERIKQLIGITVPHGSNQSTLPSGQGGVNRLGKASMQMSSYRDLFIVQA